MPQSSVIIYYEFQYSISHYAIGGIDSDSATT